MLSAAMYCTRQAQQSRQCWLDLELYASACHYTSKAFSICCPDAYPRTWQPTGCGLSSKQCVTLCLLCVQIAFGLHIWRALMPHVRYSSNISNNGRYNNSSKRQNHDGGLLQHTLGWSCCSSINALCWRAVAQLFVFFLFLFCTSLMPPPPPTLLHLNTGLMPLQTFFLLTPSLCPCDFTSSSVPNYRLPTPSLHLFCCLFMQAFRPHPYTSSSAHDCRLLTPSLHFFICL